jgi:nitroreductase
LKQPITMRVIVNRIWKGHFDTGILDTPSNFGQMGERPTNPELLEYLASSFVKNGMSIKKLHREIMLSSVYQLGTQNNEADYAKDSGNRMYWRFNRRRLDAEELRDAVMNVAGNLDDAVGGPSEELTPANKRRTVYGKISRYKLDTFLQTFDFPPPNISAEKRFTTTVPLQRLFLMNSDFMQIEAEELAKRVAPEVDNRARIKKMYQLAFTREPSEEEIKLGLDYLHTEPSKEYEENKNKPKVGGGGEKRGAAEGSKPDTGAKPESAPASETSVTGSGVPEGAPATVAAKPAATPVAASETPAAAPEGVPAPDAAADAPADSPTPAAQENAGMGMGMMDGVPGMGGRRGNGPGSPPEVKYDPSVWGRYAKVLLSSTEFLFIN